MLQNFVSYNYTNYIYVYTLFFLLSLFLLNFFTGLVATTNLYVINNSIFFYAYEKLKEKNIPYYLCATISRFLAIILTAPLELYKTNIQANVGSNYKVNVLDLFKAEKNRRIKVNVYKGVTSTLIRDIPFSAIYWSLNEYLVSFIKKRDLEFENRKNIVKKIIYPFICGCISSTVTTFITHPLDIIKTNLQARCIDVIHKSEFDYKKIKNYEVSWKNKANAFYNNVCQNNLYTNKYVCDVKTNNYAHTTHRCIYYKYGSGKYGCNTYNNKYYNYFNITNKHNLNVISVSKIIFKKNGLKGFYIGIVPRLIKIVPTCAILFSTYHYFNC